MKKTILSAMGVVLCSILCIKSNAQVVTTAEEAKTNLSEITFEKEVHNYGNIEKGANGTCEFKFKNTGKEPLIINTANGSCGCTVPEWPKNPIKPGETGIIKVKYDTHKVGAINKTVTVYTNSKTGGTKTISITGNVTPPTKEASPLKNNASPHATF